MGPADLARRLGVTTAASSGIVDRLTSRGHVVRVPHASDGRRTDVTITESGAAEVVGHLTPMFTALHELDSALDDDAARGRRGLPAGGGRRAAPPPLTPDWTDGSVESRRRTRPMPRSAAAAPQWGGCARSRLVGRAPAVVPEPGACRRGRARRGSQTVVSAPPAASRRNGRGQPPERRQRLLHARGVGPARMGRVHVDPRSSAPGATGSSSTCARLRAGVGGGRRVVARAGTPGRRRAAPARTSRPRSPGPPARPSSEGRQQGLGHRHRAQDVQRHASARGPAATRCAPAASRRRCGRTACSRDASRRRTRRRTGVRRRGRPRRSATR